jgi:hypothetical protein
MYINVGLLTASLPTHLMLLTGPDMLFCATARKKRPLLSLEMRETLRSIYEKFYPPKLWPPFHLNPFLLTANKPLATSQISSVIPPLLFFQFKIKLVLLILPLTLNINQGNSQGTFSDMYSTSQPVD